MESVDICVCVCVKGGMKNKERREVWSNSHMYIQWSDLSQQGKLKYYFKYKFIWSLKN